MMVEQTQAYSGLYYVLMGRLSPLDGIGPKEIRLERLIKRATDGVVKEAVLATNFTNEGEATAHYIGELLTRARVEGEPPRAGRSGRRRARVRRQRDAGAGAAGSAGAGLADAAAGCAGRRARRVRGAAGKAWTFPNGAGIDFGQKNGAAADRAARRGTSAIQNQLPYPVRGATTPIPWRKHDTQTSVPALPKASNNRLAPQVPEGRHRRRGRGRNARLPDDRQGPGRPDHRCAGRSTWPAKDIFHEYALDYAKKVNDMTGGDLKIEVLPAGAVVPAFGLLDAVSKGTLDGGHGVLVYHYGKQNALALWGSGPAFGMDAQHAAVVAQVRRRQGAAEQALRSIGANVVSFPYGPMPTQPLGWFKKPITKVEDFKGLKFRTVGISIDVFTGMGAAVNALPGGEIVPAMDRGLLDAAEFNNATLRPPARLPGRVEGLHAAELPPERRAVRDHVQQDQVRRAAGEDEGDHRRRRRRRLADMIWKAIDRYSKDYVELQTKDKVKFYKTPDAILQKQLELYDQVVAKKSARQPAVHGDHRVAEEVRRARGEVGPGQQREPPHGVQPLLRRRRRPTEEGLTRARRQDTIRRTRMVFFLRRDASRCRLARRRDRTGAIHAEAAAVRRQGQHLDRPGILLAHRRADAADLLGSVLALCRSSSARMGLRRR